MLSREQAGEQSLLLGLTSAPCRGMEASPLPEEFCWLRRGRHPSCSTASVSGLGLLSRTRGLRTGKSALLLDATRRDSNGQFAGSVTSAPTTPLGCVAGTPRHRNSSARPPPMGKATGPRPRSPVHLQLNCLPFHPPCDAFPLAFWRRRSLPACLNPRCSGWWRGCFRGGLPPGRLQGDICQNRPLFPQAGVPGSSVGASSVFKVKLQEHERSLTLDPSCSLLPSWDYF